MPSIEHKVADAYERALQSGSTETDAIEEAFKLWRSHHPDASEYDARSAIAHIIAERRLHLRKQGKLPGGAV